MKLKDIIREIRERKDWDIQTYAEKLGVTKNSIWRYERGTIFPSESMLARMAELGGLDVSNLLTLRLVELENLKRKRQQKAAKLPNIIIVNSDKKGASVQSDDTKQILELLKEQAKHIESLEARLRTVEHPRSHIKQIEKK